MYNFALFTYLIRIYHIK